MVTVRVDRRGRVVSPRQIRDPLGIHPRSSLSAELDGATLKLANAAEPPSPLVTRALGELRRGETTSLREWANQEGVVLADD